MSLKIGDSLRPLAIFLAELGVEPQHFLLVAGKGAAQAVIFIPFWIVQHIHVNFTHQAARAAVIQLAFSTLSHVRSSPLPLTTFWMPRVHIGEKAKPSRK